MAIKPVPSHRQRKRPDSAVLKRTLLTASAVRDLSNDAVRGPGTVIEDAQRRAEYKIHRMKQIMENREDIEKEFGKKALQNSYRKIAKYYAKQAAKALVTRMNPAMALVGSLLSEYQKDALKRKGGA